MILSQSKITITKRGANTLELNHDDQRVISGAVEEAEQHTSSQIAWKTVEESDPYYEATWIWMFLATIAGLAAKIILTQDELWYEGRVTISLMSLAACWVLGFIVGHIPFCRRLFISRKRMYKRVWEKAQASFFNHNVHMTSEKNGVLIYVSFFEQISVLVIDKGITDSIKKSAVRTKLETDLQFSWREWHNRDQFRWSLIKYIKELGFYLGRHFPPKTNGADEVTNLNLSKILRIKPQPVSTSKQ